MERLTDEQRRLVAENIGLAKAYARRRKGAQLNPDDVEQECCLALMQSVTSWNPDKGTLSTWAGYAMRAAVQRAKRRACLVWKVRPAPVAVSMQDTGLDEDGLSLDERIPDPKAANPETVADLRERVKRLLPKDNRARTVVLRFAWEETLQEVGDELNLTRERVRQIEESVISRARKTARLLGLC